MDFEDRLHIIVTELANTRALAAVNTGKDIEQDDARDGFLSPTDAMEILVDLGCSDHEADAVELVQTLFAGAWQAAVEAAYL